MILFNELWKSRQERPDPNRCQDGSWVLVAIFLLVACFLWILWMRDWMIAGMPQYPAHPMVGSRCCE
jgi:hypothetical protein